MDRCALRGPYRLGLSGKLVSESQVLALENDRTAGGVEEDFLVGTSDNRKAEGVLNVREEDLGAVTVAAGRFIGSFYNRFGHLIDRGCSVLDLDVQTRI